jgi:hypothetical protein
MEFLNGWKIDTDKINIYSDFENYFQEPINVKLCNYLLDNKYISNKEQRTMLSKIIKKAKTGKEFQYTTVMHTQKVKSTNIKCGRFYPDDVSSLIPLSRQIKHTIFKSLNFTDIDMVKGHVSIALSMAELNGIDLPTFKYFFNNRDEILCMVREEYSFDENPLTHDEVKQLFNLKLYGGGFKRWVKNLEDGDEKKGYLPKKIKKHVENDFIKKFTADRDIFVKCAMDANKVLFDKVKNEYDDMTEFEQENKNIRSFSSYYFQIIENDILYLTFKFLQKKKIIFKNFVCLEYDGLCVPRHINDSIVDELNDHLLKITKFKYIKMAKKGYSHAIDEAIEGCNENSSNVKTYEIVKDEFELTRCKILDGPIFIKNDSDSFLKYEWSKFRTAFLNVKYEDDDGKKKKFVDQWIEDEEMKTYDHIDFLPKNCPENVYNIWKPYPMENITSYEHKQDSVDFFLNHLKIMCGHDAHANAFFEGWLGNMIQYPEQKPGTVPVFKSAQGTGKGAIATFIGNAIGSEKVLETGNPEVVFGKFNGSMRTAIFIHLDEIKQSLMRPYHGIFKNLVTSKKINIEDKGFNIDTINSYARFMVSTNNDDPIEVAGLNDTERRVVFITPSEEKLGDKEYFTKLYHIIEDINSIKSIYEYFKNLKNCSFDDLKKIGNPCSQYQEGMKLRHTAPLDLWLMDFCQFKHQGKSEINDVTNKELFDDYNTWLFDNKVTNGNISSIIFGSNLIGSKFKGSIVHGKKTKTDRTKSFNLDSLRNVLGIVDATKCLF